jgi:hypothetical protein
MIFGLNDDFFDLAPFLEPEPRFIPLDGLVILGD